MSRRSASPRTSRRAYSPTGSAAALYGLLASVARRDPRDLSLTSLATLSTLERTGPRRITDLAAIEGVTQPSMTVLVTALARSGLVVRKTDSTDKRVEAFGAVARVTQRLGAEATLDAVIRAALQELAR